MRKTKSFITILFLIAATSLAFISCSNDNLEDLGDAFCDTTNVTYALSIEPIIQNSCAGCHNPANASGDVSLSNFTEVKAAADNNSLLGSIRHESGWEAMPKNGNKLDDCSIRKIELWVDAGTPNN